MRISTQWVNNTNVDDLQRQQQQLVHTQQQLSSGLRILTAADDPVAAAQALRVTQTQGMGQQYARNMSAATSHLHLVDSTLSNITNLYQSARTTLVQAGNTSLGDSDRAALAQTLQADYQQLLGMANATDAGGNYLFAGNRVGSAPFAASATGATYNGDQGQQQIQVTSSMKVTIGNNGTDLFERIPNGNGVFSTQAATTNTGSGVIGPGTVTDPTALTGHTYQLVFHVSGGNTTYDVVDSTAGATVSSANPLPAGGTVNLPGMQVTVQNAPADGDSFTVSPSANQSIFTTLQNAITALNTPVSSAGQRAQLATTIAQSLSDMDNAASQLQNIHTQVGASLNQLASLGSANTDLATQYSQQLSQLQDVDYTKAISDLNAGQLSVQATEQSYALISKLTLFNFL
jgi:flagellar hook-associated protein 3 FlgL